MKRRRKNKMRRSNKSSWIIRLRIEVIYSWEFELFLIDDIVEGTAEFPIFPKPFKNFTSLPFLESSKAIDLSLVPLPIILISILVHNFSSSVFLAIYKISIVLVPVFDNFQSRPISLEFPWFIQTDVANEQLLAVVPDCSFSNMR